MRWVLISLFIGVLFLYSCAPESTGVVSNVYHNTTAHYNAYFYAKERMREIESSIYGGADINYDEILDLYPQFDSTAVSGVSTQIEDCIKKASIAIQRHPASDWSDDSYILVGKARYYSLDYVNAIETYKFVNKNSEDDNARHEALIELMKTFIDAKEYRNAEAVSDFLKKEDVNRSNSKNMYITRAYLYQKREDYNQMVQNLSLAVPLLTNNEDRARLYYIIGQIYQKLGFDSQAYASYRSCLKSNPDFDLSFYAKLNIAQVTELSNSSDLKQVRKYFKKLLRDRKNEEFKDKIYYEIANFEFKQENVDEAISNYNKSLRISNNARQKGYSYLRLGEIYYNQLKNYELAKSYYDSVVNVLPKDEPSYEEIATRQRILADFVAQLTTIRVQDSLLALAKLDTAAIGQYVDQYIAQKKKEQEEEAQKKKNRKSSANRRSTAFENSVNQINTNLSGSTWYFYNTSAISQGRSAFNRRWGNRPLEDNWRRSSKEQLIGDPSAANTASEQVAAGENNNTGPAENKNEFDRKSMMAAVPITEEAQNQSLKLIEEAHFRLGNIYDFDLEEKENAIETFEKMLSRFPTTEYKPEVMYQLYLLYKAQDNPRQDFYRNALITEFPKSDYAKIIINPNFRAESQAATAKLEKVYKQAYELQENGQFKPALAILRSSLREYPENEFSDNLKLLEIIIMGHTEDIYKYQYELNNFISTYSESELLPYAQTLVKSSEEYQINLFNSSRAKFIKYFDQEHFFVLVYGVDKVLAEKLPGEVQRFYKSEFPRKKLSTANLILDSKYSIIMVNEFPNKEEAQVFYDVFQKSAVLDQFKQGDFSVFTITKDNFKIFYETKELDSYMKFFGSNYQSD